MKISSISQSDCKPRNIEKCKKPSFQANLLSKTNELLIMEAKRTGLLANLIEQFKQIKNWGSCKSFIGNVYDNKTGKSFLKIENYSLSTKHNSKLEVDENSSLLKQFLSLNKEKIIKGENNIKDKKEKEKLDAIIKITTTPKFMKKLTGEINPSDEKLARAIENLTEEQLTNYKLD